MNPRLVLLVALLLAGATAWFVHSWMSGQEQAQVAQKAATSPPPIPTVEVLVTKQALPVGTFIKPEHLVWKAWPKGSVVPGYLVKGTASERDLVGAVVRTQMFAGEPLTKERVVHPGDQGFLAAVLDPGKRAVSVPIDAIRGVGGFVFPGDFVDVVLSFKRDVRDEDANTGGAETRYFSQTVLTDVRVLGIDQTVHNDDNAAKVGKTATLEVTPKQAEKVAVALELGELSLSLRSLGRPDQHEMKMADLERRLEAAKSPTSAARAPSSRDAYTSGTDILSMVGEPDGFPAPGGNGAKINVLRGDKASVVKY